ncbi:MAG: hypothetical protein ACM3TR_01765 [Caulobacteraceae bacterium]
MKSLYMGLILIFCFTMLNFSGMGIDNLDLVSERYKRALDAGAYAAAKHQSYSTAEYLEGYSSGFGTGTEHMNNLPLNPDESLEWFYRVFYRNLGIEEDKDMQEKLKSYISMKTVVSFDRILIADSNDNWIVGKTYDIEHNGALYRFTLSDQVLNLATGEWRKDTDFGITPETRKIYVNSFIKREIDRAINTRANFESNKYYDVPIAYNDFNPKSDGIKGVNFIVFAEGMPLPSFNPNSKNRKFYAYGIGGSEITRAR